MTSKAYTEKENVSTGVLFLKVAIGISPALVVSALSLPHHRVMFSAALVVGALLQYAISPRKHLVLTMVGASAIAFIYYLGWRFLVPGR